MHPSPHAADGHYHLHVHTISKLKGHSIQAAAAYRRAQVFRGNETSVTHAAAYQRAQELGNNGRVFDYRRKIGVAWTGIIAPEHTPKELLDAQTLWNTVERIESRKNARLAREMIIALPHQVDLDIHIAMLRVFISTNLTSRGMIADVAIHKPPVEHGGDPRNWHAHVLLTDRPITPEGFAAKKDRMWNAKENLLLWRKAWADTHNATMEHLGLPHRIDHRTLEQQRQVALQRADERQAIILDRLPQIHLGKAAYGSHPKRTVYRDRLRQNRQILQANSTRHENHKGDTQRQHFAAAHATLRESATIKHAEDTWQPEPASLHELEATYGRPPPATKLARLKALAFDTEVRRRALDISRPYHHPWFASGHREDAPSLIDILRPTVKTTGPGHPVFTVTAKDLAFCFYSLGFIHIRQLQSMLEDITREEQRLFADRIERQKHKPPPPPPTPKRPTFERPQLALKQKLDARLGNIQTAVALHHQREHAFEERYAQRTWVKQQRQRDRETRDQAWGINRSRIRTRPPVPPSNIES